jgi:uncharacterized protein (TIGR03084 family)
MTSHPTAAATDRSAVLAGVVADLAAETRELRELLADLGESDFDRPTPAAGWSIRDQVTHLAFFDDATLLALTDPAAFTVQRDELVALGHTFPDIVAERHRHLAAGAARDWLHRSREQMLTAFRAADPAARLPWYGPAMSVVSSATGRLMETWAHGQDIRDTLDVRPSDTARLRHIADLGIRAFAFCFTLRDQPVPATAVRVELTAADGSRWTWGPADATDRVTGAALDFCLVVTQRRNAADTGLRIAGPVAAAWIAIAQAFAGAATDPRPAGGFPRQARR